jgi:hypothetical protein
MYSYKYKGVGVTVHSLWNRRLGPDGGEWLVSLSGERAPGAILWAAKMKA